MLLLSVYYVFVLSHMDRARNAKLSSITEMSPMIYCNFFYLKYSLLKNQYHHLNTNYFSEVTN
jgi:hypothetical protein